MPVQIHDRTEETINQPFTLDDTKAEARLRQVQKAELANATVTAPEEAPVEAWEAFTNMADKNTEDSEGNAHVRIDRMKMEAGISRPVTADEIRAQVAEYATPAAEVQSTIDVTTPTLDAPLTQPQENPQAAQTKQEVA